MQYIQGEDEREGKDPGIQSWTFVLVKIMLSVIIFTTKKFGNLNYSI